MKRALIVDDSRLARHVLSRLLSEHGVAADTAQSAEAALEYLKERRPDVVFLDHLMPGMDGFEALEAIKANPLTATIPVMMYTSQAGELYLGEARALGALGVLPKSLEPVEVTKVLRSLRLIPAEKTPTPSAAAPTEPRPLDSHRLRELLEELFYEHGSALREEMRKELQRLAPPTPAPPPMPPPQVERRGARALPSNVFKVATALLLPLCALLAYFYLATGSLLQEANEQTRSLARSTTALSAAGARADLPRAQSVDTRYVLDALEWAINQTGRFGFGEVPLNDDRARLFMTFFEQLRDLGFRGTVAIDVHVGRFCMNYAGDGSLQLAAPEQPALACEQIGWPEAEAVTMGTQQSLVFANTVATASAQSAGVRVATMSHGTSEPAMDYPPWGYDVTAGVWNAIAASNQRVVVRLEALASAQP
jgi:CheY-like chemotaxis protein